MHDHVHDAVSVYLTDLRVKVTTASGEVEDRPGKAGQVSFSLADGGIESRTCSTRLTNWSKLKSGVDDERLMQ
jgi:hypothetical protein